MINSQEAAAEYPVQKLVFFLEDDYGEGDVARLRDHISRLAPVRQWTIGPPEFIDSRESADSQEDRTVGGILPLYSALPDSSSRRLPKELDESHLADVEFLIEQLSAFSAETGLDLGLELDGTAVGWIDDGRPDKLLREGLIGEWRRTLGNKKHDDPNSP